MKAQFLFCFLLPYIVSAQKFDHSANQGGIYQVNQAEFISVDSLQEMYNFKLLALKRCSFNSLQIDSLRSNRPLGNDYYLSHYEESLLVIALENVELRERALACDTVAMRRWTSFKFQFATDMQTIKMALLDH